MATEDAGFGLIFVKSWSCIDAFLQRLFRMTICIYQATVEMPGLTEPQELEEFAMEEKFSKETSSGLSGNDLMGEHCSRSMVSNISVAASWKCCAAS